MGREKDRSYVKLNDGYARQNQVADQFMFDVLGNKVNIVWWRKLLCLVCKAVGHTEDERTQIAVGFTNTYGTFHLSLCKWCRTKVIFYERTK